MIVYFFTIIWFFLPAGIANMAPVFAAKIPGIKNLNYPMDFNLSWRGRRILGDHKTMRGLVSGIITGIITVWIQKKLIINSDYLSNLINIDYLKVNWLLLGMLLGGGAIIGDAAKSFFKRQTDIPSGQSWFVFDQIDYILGGIIFSIFYWPLTLLQYLSIVIIFFLLHIIVTNIGFVLGLKEKPI